MNIINESIHSKSQLPDVFDESDKKKISYINALSILSIRECEILAFSGSGYSAKEIALELSLSVHTIRTHIKASKKKLNLFGNRSLVQWYRLNNPKTSPV